VELDDGALLKPAERLPFEVGVIVLLPFREFDDDRNDAEEEQESGPPKKGPFLF